MKKFKEYNRFIKTVILVLFTAVLAFLLILLSYWTRDLQREKKQRDLRKTLREAINTYGEKGFLEMLGVPAGNIYYDAGTYYNPDGTPLFNGEDANWTHTSEELLGIAIFEHCNKAVVHINTSASVSVSEFLDTVPQTGVGSGFFISADGYIITNHHVIDGASNIEVTLYDGTKYNAVVTGSDVENDIAVIKIEVPDNAEITTLAFANSDTLSVGQRVYAIGNPFGYDRTMASGIISGLSRPIRSSDGRVLLGMIQTDTPINPGSSGGPLLDSRGRVIGISTSIYSSTGFNQGMNFAVSSKTAEASSGDLIKYGKINRGWLDLVPVQLSRQIIEYASLKVNSGILISQVVPGGKADAAGLRGGNTQVRYGSSLIYLGGDVITSINGISVSEYSDLFTALSNTRPGEKVNVLVNRGGKQFNIKTELVERTSELVSFINR